MPSLMKVCNHFEAGDSFIQIGAFVRIEFRYLMFFVLVLVLVLVLGDQNFIEDEGRGRLEHL